MYVPTFRRSPILSSAVALAGLFAIGACSDSTPSSVASPGVAPAIEVRLVHAPAVEPGRIVVALEIEPSPELPAVAAAEFSLEWSPSRLAYLGQLPAERGLVMVGDDRESEGSLEVIALDLAGLDIQPAMFVFETVGEWQEGEVSLDALSLVDARGGRVDHELAGPRAAGEPVETGAAARPGVDEWIEVLGGDVTSDRPAEAPGSGLIFGDVTLDGSIDVSDVVSVANVAVGALELIVGSDNPGRDAVVAGNVRPANLPGLGGPADDCPPGAETCGGSFERRIDVFDVVGIASASVGNPEPIVGQPVPQPAAGDTVALGGSITSLRTLDADTVYRLDAPLVVESGGELVAGPGVTIVGTAGNGIVVRRDGRISLEGSLSAPVVLTGEVEGLGAWPGLVILGNAPINRGALGGSGCIEVVDDPRDGAFGGCDPNDDRGALRFVRVEYSLRGVELLGVGAGTQIEALQVFGSELGGVKVAGGTVDLRRLLVNASTGYGVAWQDGWRGRGQYLILQFDPLRGGFGLVGTNALDNVSAPTPSRPTLHNVTAVGLTPTAPTGSAVRIAGGSGALISNLLALGTPTGFDVDGPESCSALGTDLRLRSSIFAGIPSIGDPDPDDSCPDGASTEALYLDDPSISEVTDGTEVAQLLKGALDPIIPDFRSAPDGAAGTLTGATPPSDGWFDPAGTFIGGDEVAAASTANIPWYSGWTRGGVLSSLAFGNIQGTVTLSGGATGVLPNVVVTADLGDISSRSDPTGEYFIPFVRPGSTNVSLSGLPTGCIDPGPVAVTVSPGSTSFADFTVVCGVDPVADLMVDVDLPANVAAGDTVDVVVSSANDGPLPASTVLLSSFVSNGLEIIDVTNSGFAAGGTATWPPFALASGASRIDTVRVVVSGVAGGTTQTASASVGSEVLDPDASDNVANASTVVGPGTFASDAAFIAWRDASGYTEAFKGDLRWGRNDVSPAADWETGLVLPNFQVLAQGEALWGSDAQAFEFRYGGGAGAEAGEAFLDLFDASGLVAVQADVSAAVMADPNSLLIRARAGTGNTALADVRVALAATGDTIFAKAVAGDADAVWWTVADPRLADGFSVVGTVDLDATAGSGSDPSVSFHLGRVE